MAFKIGDIITGTENNYYSITNDRALMLVTKLYSDGDMKVLVLYHNSERDQIRNNFGVMNSSTKFKHTTLEEFLEKYPDCYKMKRSELNRTLLEYAEYNESLSKYIQVKQEEKEMVEPYVLTETQRAELLDEMTELLTKFNYHPTTDALNKIIDKWCKNKAPLIRLFEKHPNYNGKFQIAFDYDFDRVIDKDAILNFRDWLEDDEVNSTVFKDVKIGVYSYKELCEICDRLKSFYYIFVNHSDINIREINGKTASDYLNEYNHFYEMKRMYERSNDIIIDGYHAYDRETDKKHDLLSNVRALLNSSCCTQFVEESARRHLNRYFPDAKIKNGQKMSRAINKVLCMLGVDKHPDYNKEFAKFSDAINPLKIKRHTVISIHPVDYYTMSFGNSWNSCHTIDKRNLRGIGNAGYRGCNSSGTESYMLDGTSCVFYTVDGSYDGNQLELENKINRCMFHYNDNQLVQGRVYPQSNDEGANDLYKSIREICQKVFADMLEVPNYWTNNKGTYACTDVIISDGTHYRDYENFNNCNVSTLKDDRDRHEYIEVGHNPICPNCGVEHTWAESIECSNCYEG